MSVMVKKNVATFEQDDRQNSLCRYVANAPFSSQVSNRRLSDETDKIIRALGSKVRSVIDIGCGDGTYTHELAVRMPGVSFTGFDPAAKAIEAAGQKFQACTFTVGNVLDVSTFPDRSFDLAIMRGVIHHLPLQKEAIENAFHLSSRLLIIEPNGDNPILKIIERKSQYHIDHEEQSFSSALFLRVARELGVEVKALTFVGFVPFFFPTLPAKVIHFFQPLLEKVPFLAKYFGGQIVLLLECPQGRIKR